MAKSGDEEHVDIHLEVFERDLTQLAAIADQDFSKINATAETQLVYQRVRDVIALTVDTDCYQVVFNSIAAAFGTTPYPPGSIGAHFVACDRERAAGVSSYQCTPACILGIKPPHVPSCQSKVYTMRGLELVLINDGADQVLHIYTTETVPRFQSSDLDNLRKLNPSKVKVFHLPPSGASTLAWEGPIEQMSLTMTDTTAATKRSWIWIAAAIILILVLLIIAYVASNYWYPRGWRARGVSAARYGYV
jgi:hypothetical protein